MSIFDLVDLADDVALQLVQATLDRYPMLKRLFDPVFIDRLIRCSRNMNFLLFLLVQPEDAVANKYWAEVVDDMLLLEPEDSFKHFKRKLRMRSRPDLEAGRSELALAARLKRQGLAVALEVPTRDGRDCDIRVDTMPQTWWEVKAVADADFIVKDEEIARRVQQGLQRIDQPYVLSLVPSTVTIGDVARAVKSIKSQLYAHYRTDGAIPVTFDAHGLKIQVTTRSKGTHGYLGIISSGLYAFAGEHSERIRDRIGRAVSQLPDVGGGVVVIDSTDATWVDANDVIDACFGPTRSFLRNGEFVDVHDATQGAFHPEQRTRVSAVVHYSRHPRHTEGGGESYGLYVVHNPFARIPLANEVFSGEDVLHCRAVSGAGGAFTITRDIRG